MSAVTFVKRKPNCTKKLKFPQFSKDYLEKLGEGRGREKRGGNLIKYIRVDFMTLFQKLNYFMVMRYFVLNNVI
jgi:hypothetical protein